MSPLKYSTVLFGHSYKQKMEKDMRFKSTVSYNFYLLNRSDPSR